MMPNDIPTYQGTGEFPPPRSFYGAGTEHPRFPGDGPDAAHGPGSKGDPHLAPLKTVGLLCAAALAVLALGIVLWVVECASGAPGKADAAEQLQASLVTGAVESFNAASLDAGAPKVAKSTPRASWRLGQTPMLYQTDPEWSSQAYGDGSIATHGCGPTCLSMAYVRLTGEDDMDPQDMAEFSTLNGYVDEGVTSWLLMSEGASYVGLRSAELPASPSAVRQALLEDRQVICSVHQGDFTNEGHFILLADMNPDGTVEIRDPNSEERTSKAWDLDRIVSQCDNIWALGI